MIRTLGSVYVSCSIGRSFWLSTSENRLATILEESEIVQLFDQGYFTKEDTFAIADLTERASVIVIIQLVEIVNEADRAMIADLTSDFTEDVGIVFSAPLVLSDRQQVNIWGGDYTTIVGTLRVPPGRYNVIVRGRVAEYIDIEEFPELKEEYDNYWLKRSNSISAYINEEELTGDPEIDWSLINVERRPSVFTVTLVPTVDPPEVTVHLPRRRVSSIVKPWQT